MNKILSVLLLIAVVSFALTACPAREQSLVIWTQEGTAEGAYQFVQALAEEFAATRPELTIEVVNKETEALREDFQNASLAGGRPTCCGRSMTMPGRLWSPGLFSRSMIWSISVDMWIRLFRMVRHGRCRFLTAII